MRCRQAIIAVLAALVAVALGTVAYAQVAAPSPPGQPVSGPGGSDTRFSSLTKRSFGSGAASYWIFSPSTPIPPSAPVVVFLHGWSAMDPNIYGAWIEHIVRHDGAVVVYPEYQDSLTDPTPAFLPNVMLAVKDAFARLQSGEIGIRPVKGQIAFVGHSEGGLLSANLAAVAAANGIPEPAAIMCVEPGKSWGPRIAATKVEDLSRVPQSTLLLTVVGDRDMIARDTDAIKIFNQSTAVPAANKGYVIMQSDNHGLPPLTANHFAPVAVMQIVPEQSAAAGGQDSRVGAQTGPLRERLQSRSVNAGGSSGRRFVNAYGYCGIWKLFDALTDAAFYGTHRDYALGGGPNMVNMGTWSDGVPVKPLLVETVPVALAR